MYDRKYLNDGEKLLSRGCNKQNWITIIQNF